MSCILATRRIAACVRRKGDHGPGIDPTPAAERALRMASRREIGLYDPRNEHDACGVGFVANIKGRKSHDIIRRGLQILVNLDHRGAVGADPLVGDGAGCMIQMPDGAAARLGRQARPRLCRRPAAMRSRCAFCRWTKRRAPSRSRISSILSALEGQSLARLARCRRSTRPGSAKRSSRRCRRSRRRSSRPPRHPRPGRSSSARS